MRPAPTQAKRIVTLSHAVTQSVDAPPARAFAYLRDPLALGRWALGCFDSAPTDQENLYAGRSLFDGATGWFRIDADPVRLEIDYLVGTPDKLARRISARVMPGAELGYPEASCLVTLTAWRPAGMTASRWDQLCASHEVEILLIKAQLETD